MPIILVVCAWDLGWWQAYIFSLLFIVSGVGARIWAEQRYPGLMEERQRIETVQDAKPWDKILAPLTGFSVSYLLIIFAGFDHRFGWSPVFPIWLNIIGFLIIASGYTFASWAMVENKYFSSFVRIQSDRGHVVCDSGPYKIVRHPGYAGIILSLPGIVLALGSIWTTIPAVIALLIILIRTSLEDDVLKKELPGYLEYTKRVRYRLIPGFY